MKNKPKKKGGFTLVEIIIAFAIFSIMAAMLVQMLNLTINRRRSNDEFQKNLAEQEQNLYAKAKDTTYDSAVSADGQLDLNFGDTSMTINYQYKNNNDSVADVKAGINYFTGNLDYDGEIGGTNQTSTPETSNPEDVAGSQMQRFDTRISGTKGISSVKINSISGGTPNADGTYSYTVSFSVNDSGVSSDYKSHSQITLYFGKTDQSSSGIRVVDVSSPYFDKYVKTTGLNGVNIHVGQGTQIAWWPEALFSDGSWPTSFTVKLNQQLPAGFNINSFGSNASNGEYTPYEYKGEPYVNIFGAYVTADPAPGGESS